MNIRLMKLMGVGGVALMLMVLVAVFLAYLVVVHSDLARDATLGANLAAFSVVGLMALAGLRWNTHFFAALPITTRQLNLARSLSLVVVVWLPAAAVAGILLRFDRDPRNARLWLLLEAVALSTLADLVLQYRILPRFHAAHWLVRAPAFLVFVWILSPWHLPAIPVVGVCALASLVLFVLSWTSIPAAVEIASVGEAGDVREPFAAAQASRGLAWRIVLRACWTWRLVPWLVCWFLAVQLGQWMIWAPSLWMQMEAMHHSSRWLRPLPIRRDIAWCAIALPTLLILVAGYFVGIHGPFYDDTGRRMRIVESLRTPSIVPPLEFWIPAPAGHAPPIEAPWGETFQPPTIHMLGKDIYNPFAVGPDSTSRFFDWQHARAGAAASLTKPVLPQFRMQLLHLAGILAWTLLVMIYAGLADWYRLRRLTRRVRIALLAIPPALFVALALSLGLQSPATGLDSLVRFEDAMLWLHWTLPGSLAALLAVLAATLAALGWSAIKLAAVAE